MKLWSNESLKLHHGKWTRWHGAGKKSNNSCNLHVSFIQRRSPKCVELILVGFYMLFVLTLVIYSRCMNNHMKDFNVN